MVPTARSPWRWRPRALHPGGVLRPQGARRSAPSATTSSPARRPRAAEREQTFAAMVDIALTASAALA